MLATLRPRRCPAGLPRAARRTGTVSFPPTRGFASMPCSTRACSAGAVVRRLPRARPSSASAGHGETARSEPRPAPGSCPTVVSRAPQRSWSRTSAAVSPIRLRRPRSQRQAPGEHLRRCEGEPLRFARACSARTPTCPIAVISGAASRSDQVRSGLDDHRRGGRRRLPSRPERRPSRSRDQHQGRHAFPIVCDTSCGPRRSSWSTPGAMS